MSRLNVVDYLTSLVRTGYSPIVMLEQMGNVRGSCSMRKMAATTWSVVSYPDQETLNDSEASLKVKLLLP